MPQDHLTLRHATPNDYAPIIAVINDWWGGRQMADMLPKLFFVHFQDTSFVVEDAGEQVAFLIGFRSQTYPTEAYIHFVGVHPDYRQHGLARSLYERFFETVLAQGCQQVRCLTSLVNRTSIAFHQRMGFELVPSGELVEGIPLHRNYDGRGGDRVLFVRDLTGFQA